VLMVLQLQILISMLRHNSMKSQILQLINVLISLNGIMTLLELHTVKSIPQKILVIMSMLKRIWLVDIMNSRINLIVKVEPRSSNSYQLQLKLHVESFVSILMPISSPFQTLEDQSSVTAGAVLVVHHQLQLLLIRNFSRLSNFVIGLLQDQCLLIVDVLTVLYLMLILVVLL
jgi:hypothetical protein